MAIRINSVKFPVNYNTGSQLTNNTTSSLGSVIVYAPENGASTPITCSSALLYLSFQDASTATGVTSIGRFTASVQLSGSNTGSAVASASLIGTAENIGGILGPFDFTSYFVSNYGTGTAKSASVTMFQSSSGGTGLNLTASYAYMEFTYLYDDSTARRIKTVCVPYESGLSTLTTTANTQFATMSVLTGSDGLFNGYNTPIVRYRWLEVKGNCNNNNTATIHALSYRFDANTAVALTNRHSALATDTYQMYQIDASNLDASTTHSFQLWNSLASRWANIVVDEWITYEYDVSGTTTALNYMEIPVEFNSPIAGTTVNQAHLVRKSFLINEPGTIVTKNCAVELFYNTAATATVNLKVGSQAAYRAYAMSANVVGGMFSLQHRLDTGSVSGVGNVLVRGENSVDISMFRSVGAMSNVTGIIKLLYTSGVASGGIDTHNKTIYSRLKPFSLTLTGDDVVSGSLNIPETNYWYNSMGIQYFFWMTGTAGQFIPLMVQSKILAGESNGGGWREIFNDCYSSDGELGFSTWYVGAKDEFDIYPRDVDTDKLNISSSRGYRTVATTTMGFGTRFVASYNSITTMVSGTITNSSGGTVTLDLYKNNLSGLPSRFDTTTRVGNGAYSFTVYDDTVSYYVVAYESTTSKGVSKEAVPNTDFDISLSSVGGGGEFFF